MNQLERIIEGLGWPSEDDVKSWNCPHAPAFLDACSPAVKHEDRKVRSDEMTPHPVSTPPLRSASL